MKKLLITGDLFVSDNLKDKNLLSSEIIQFFESIDYRIVNLESPLTSNNSKNKIFKTGPHLRSSEGAMIPILKDLKVDLVTLANNHIMDYGNIGLNDTIKTCKNNAINVVGVGENIKEAQKPFILNTNDLNIAIINFAENEWASARKNTPGANPMDIISNVKQIQKAKKIADHVIVIIHGGHEFYNLISPRMVKQYQFYAENGASVIIGHHAHCISGYEIHQGVPIFYSLGNMLFTRPMKIDDWYIGLLLNLEFYPDKSIKWSLHPTKQNNKDYKIFLLKSDEKDEVLNRVQKYSIIIKDENKLQNEWNKYLIKSKYQYINTFSILHSSIRSLYLRAAITKMGLNKLFINKRYISRLLNTIRCESHYDATLEIIDKYLK